VTNGLSAPSITQATISGQVLASNIVTITTAAAHGFSVGDVVTIAGALGAPYTGTYTIAAVPSTVTFTYFKLNANVAATANAGTASVLTITASYPGDATWSAGASSGNGLTVTTGTSITRLRDQAGLFITTLADLIYGQQVTYYASVVAGHIDRH